MKNLLIGVLALGSVSTFAAIDENINQIKSRIPDVGIVGYKAIESLKIGDEAISQVEHKIPSPGNYVVKKRILCVDKVTTSTVQQGENLGETYLRTNSAVSIGGTLYTCH
jgi:hypothetical protein